MGTTKYLAHRIVKDLRRQQAEYDEACEADWKAGYRPHYCIHGRDQWVDYDVICGPCEDGFGRYEGLALYQLALEEAHRREEVALSRLEVYRLATDRNAPREIQDALLDWAIQAHKGR